MKSITVTNEQGFSMTFTEVYTDGFLLENATGVQEAKADVIRTENAMGDGSIWNSSRMKERNIVLTLRDLPHADHRRNRARLYRLFPIKSGGTLTYTDGTVTRVIPVYCESVVADAKNLANSFTISLISPNPYFTDPEPTDVALAAWEGAFEWPAQAATPDTGEFEFDAQALDTDVQEFGTRTEDLIVTCENAGDVPCGFVLTFSAAGTITDPGILNVDTGEQLTLNLTLGAGDSVAVDTRFGHRTAVLTSGGVQYNVFRYITAGSTFLQLPPGESHFTATLGGSAATSADLDISIRYETNYIGA